MICLIIFRKKNTKEVFKLLKEFFPAAVDKEDKIFVEPKESIATPASTLPPASNLIYRSGTALCIAAVEGLDFAVTNLLDIGANPLHYIGKKGCYTVLHLVADDLKDKTSEETFCEAAAKYVTGGIFGLNALRRQSMPLTKADLEKQENILQTLLSKSGYKDVESIPHGKHSFVPNPKLAEFVTDCIYDCVMSSLYDIEDFGCSWDEDCGGEIAGFCTQVKNFD